MKSGFISIIALFMALLMLPMISLASNVFIIANESVPTMSLTSEDIKEIFLGRRISWENGEKVVFVVQDRTEASDTFLKTYVRKNAYDYDVFWKKQVFTGKGQIPPSFSSDQELVQFVAQTPGAIGYVSSNIDTENIKTIPVR